MCVWSNTLVEPAGDGTAERRPNFNTVIELHVLLDIYRSIYLYTKYNIMPRQINAIKQDRDHDHDSMCVQKTDFFLSILVHRTSEDFCFIYREHYQTKQPWHLVEAHV